VAKDISKEVIIHPEKVMVGPFVLNSLLKMHMSKASLFKKIQLMKASPAAVNKLILLLTSIDRKIAGSGADTKSFIYSLSISQQERVQHKDFILHFHHKQQEDDDWAIGGAIILKTSFQWKKITGIGDCQFGEFHDGKPFEPITI